MQTLQVYYKLPSQLQEGEELLERFQALLDTHFPTHQLDRKGTVVWVNLPTEFGCKQVQSMFDRAGFSVEVWHLREDDNKETCHECQLSAA